MNPKDKWIHNTAKLVWDATRLSNTPACTLAPQQTISQYLFNKQLRADSVQVTFGETICYAQSFTCDGYINEIKRPNEYLRRKRGRIAAKVFSEAYDKYFK